MKMVMTMTMILSIVLLMSMEIMKAAKIEKENTLINCKQKQ